MGVPGQGWRRKRGNTRRTPAKPKASISKNGIDFDASNSKLDLSITRGPPLVIFKEVVNGVRQFPRI